MLTDPIRILLVEDNIGDIELVGLAFEEYGLPNEMSVAHDGLEALRHVRNVKPLPELILLDLNMPKMNGMEFLDVIRQDPGTKGIPVIILTSSKAILDIQDSYKRHANCYIVKPNNLKSFIDVARQVEEFWTQLPPLPHGAAA